MKAKSLQWALPILLILSLLSVAAASAQGGQAELIIINYVGEPMTFEQFQGYCKHPETVGRTVFSFCNT